MLILKALSENAIDLLKTTGFIGKARELYAEMVLN
jgi:hypothetical protein